DRLVFFFSSRRRHTRFSRDWSSDVCSSDLNKPAKTQAVTGCRLIPCWIPLKNSNLMRVSAERAAMKKKQELKKEFSPSEMNSANGTPNASVRNSGTCLTEKSIKEKM